MASKIKVDQIQTGDGTGTIALQNQLSGMTAASMPTGSVLQVVSARPAVTLTTTSSSWVATGTELNITPTATSSKILVLVNSGLFWANTSNSPGSGGGATIYRDSTNLGIGGTAHMSRTYRIGAVSIQDKTSMSILDSPNTTSSVKYEVYMKSIWSNPSMRWNDQGSDIATITLMEIAG